MQNGPSLFQAILIDVGSEKLTVIKQIRTILGNGLAEAKSMTDNTPVLLKTNLSRWEADHIQNDFRLLGARVEIQSAGDTSIVPYPNQGNVNRPQYYQRSRKSVNLCIVFLLIILLLWFVGAMTQEKDDPWTNALTGEIITCRRVGCGRTPVYHEWNRRFCTEHIQETRSCRYPNCDVQIPNSSLYEHCDKHR